MPSGFALANTFRRALRLRISGKAVVEQAGSGQNEQRCFIHSLVPCPIRGRYGRGVGTNGHARRNDQLRRQFGIV